MCSKIIKHVVEHHQKHTQRLPNIVKHVITHRQNKWSNIDKRNDLYCGPRRAANRRASCIRYETPSRPRDASRLDKLERKRGHASQQIFPHRGKSRTPESRVKRVPTGCPPQGLRPQALAPTQTSPSSLSTWADLSQNGYGPSKHIWCSTMCFCKVFLQRYNLSHPMATKSKYYPDELQSYSSGAQIW
jgi:hypothetical protein